MDLFVSLPDAMLGGKIQAPTPDGPVNVTIAPNTNSGGVMRLKGRGGYVRDGAKDARGDLFAHIVIALPDKASDVPDELTDLVTRWRGRGGYTPSHPGRGRK
jgi:DnaJ-class molecular chaperone